MENGKPVPVDKTRNSPMSSRRHAIATMFGAGSWLSGGLAAAEASPPLRLAISESLITDVNTNDARAAMSIWVNRIAQDMKIAVEFNPKIFDSTEVILSRARKGQFDAVALNVVEYRQIADVLDSSQIIAEAGASGPEQYVVLVKQGSGIQQIGDLRGRRLMALKTPKMCVAGAWLSTLLDEAHYGGSERSFASVITDTKPSRVVLPVFFGQADACLTSKRGFDTICELNPQVARNLNVIATSPAMVVSIYVFRKNYRDVQRDRFVNALAGLSSTQVGRQLSTLFQFGDLVVKDASCLAPALTVLDTAERVRGRQGAGSRKE